MNLNPRRPSKPRSSLPLQLTTFIGRQRELDVIRALLEDRYGRAVKPSEMTFRKVKPPLLRDPSLPYDQMDNFPSGKADEIASGLDRQPDGPRGDREVRLKKTGSLKEIKTPWGW